jgi:hypothetical protein
MLSPAWKPATAVTDIGYTMEIRINDAVIGRATKCERAFSCLTDNLEGSCRVRKYVSDEGLFVEDGEDEACAYLRVFGSARLCLCPVRKEIYKRYGV